MRSSDLMSILMTAFSVAATLVSPAATAAPKCADPPPAWADNTNFSAALKFDDLVIIGTDECGFLQVGRWSTWKRTGNIQLEPPRGGGDQPKEVEVDVEALAFDGRAKFVYAIGSHSKTRKRSDKAADKYEDNRAHLQTGDRPVAIESHPERERLYRFPFDPQQVDAWQGSRPEVLSLTPILDRLPVFTAFMPLASKENGIDIEGMTVGYPIGGTTPADTSDTAWLYVGFRGPVLRHGFVPVLALRTRDLDPLFSAWKAQDTKAVDDASRTALENGQVLFVPLDGRGIRDLTFVGDGFLVLAGPVGDGDAAHRIYWWNGRDCVPGKGVASPRGELRWLADVVAPTSETGVAGKAEALVLTGRDSKKRAYTMTLLFDSLENGARQTLVLPTGSAGGTPATKLCGPTG